MAKTQSMAEILEEERKKRAEFLKQRVARESGAGGTPDDIPAEPDPS